MSSTAKELLELDPDGLQLTPGNVPTKNFIAKLDDAGVPRRSHQGFSRHARMQDVWSGSELRVQSDSVHPPEDASLRDVWFACNERGEYRDTAMEVMYGNHLLGCGRDVERAMDQWMWLAVDVSHVKIQRQSAAMSDGTWRRLQRYERIAEVHVSDNDGSRDQHRPITTKSFGLRWAVERSAEVPLILESYMHRKSSYERRQQVELIRSIGK